MYLCWLESPRPLHILTFIRPVLTMLCAILMDILCCADRAHHWFEHPQPSYVDLDTQNINGLLIWMEYACDQAYAEWRCVQYWLRTTKHHCFLVLIEYAQIAPSWFTAPIHLCFLALKYADLSHMLTRRSIMIIIFTNSRLVVVIDVTEFFRPYN